jgi:ABC-2 type transport system permease protein
MSYNNYIGFSTLVRKEVRRFMGVWLQTILPPAVTTILYFIIFGQLIGTRIGDFNGIEYIDYIAPGLIMMSVIMNAYANVSSSFFMSKIFKNIEELLVCPLPNWLILSAYITGGIIRGILVAIVVGFIAFIFAGFTILSAHHLFFMIAGILLGSTVFSLAGFINGVYAKKFDDISIIPTFVLTPLTYLGGVFYSIHLLPEFWQKVSMLNPILYFVNLFRYAILDVSDVNVWFALSMLCGFCIVLYAFCLYLLNRGVGIKT